MNCVKHGGNCAFQSPECKPTPVQRLPGDCQCKGIEEFLHSDTAGEFSGVAVVCDLCGRDFTIDDVSEPGFREREALNALKTKDAIRVREERGRFGL